MNLEALLNQCRFTLDDFDSPQLWTDPELTSYLNDAEREACRRASLLVDSTTSNICQIAVEAGTATYAISPLIVRILRAKLVLGVRALGFVTTQDLDATEYNWSTRIGTPTLLVSPEDTVFPVITLFRNPIVNDTLNMRVRRLPMTVMVTDEDTPEIDGSYHMDLVDWACHLAYLKQDADAYDLKKSQAYEVSFTNKFGPRPTARMEYTRKVLSGQGSMRGRKMGR